MKSRSRLSASFKRHYWRLVEECLSLFPTRARAGKREHLARVRRDATEMTYHLEPIEAAKLVLGLTVVPDEVAKQYRTEIQGRFAALAE